MSEARPLDDADLDALRASEGIALAVTTRPYVEYATVDSMRNFARSYGDDNPLFGDEDYGRMSRWGSMVAPPLFPIGSGIPVLAPAEPGAIVRHALRGVAVTVLTDRWTLNHWVRPGARLVRADSIAAVGVEETVTAPTVVITTRSAYTEGDVLYATHDRVRVHGGRSIADADDAREGKATYDDGVIAEIDQAIAAWQRRGSAKFDARTIKAGQQIGPMVKGPLTVTDLVAYRGGVGPGPFGVEPLDLARLNRIERPDFYDRDDTGAWDARERLHWDEAYAQRCGHPSAYDYTHTRLNWMVHLLTDWMGDNGRIEAISFDHSKHNYVGDTHWIDGIVREVRASDDDVSVDIGLRGVNQLGVETCQGEATVAFTELGR